MTVEVKKVLNSAYATQFTMGVLLWEALNQAPSLEELVISFEGIELLSTAFVNQSIGRFALEHPEEIQKVEYNFPLDKPIFKYKVEDVIENALLGDEYDRLVEEAIHSL